MEALRMGPPAPLGTGADAQMKLASDDGGADSHGAIVQNGRTSSAGCGNQHGAPGRIRT